MKKMFSIIMSLILLVSTTGFSLHQHICQMKNEVTYSFFNEGSCKCDHQQKCPHHKEKKRGCCDDKIEYIQLHQNYESNLSIEADLILVSAPLVYHLLLVHTLDTKEIALWETEIEFPPPNVIDDIPVFIQSFLI